VFPWFVTIIKSKYPNVSHPILNIINKYLSESYIFFSTINHKLHKLPRSWDLQIYVLWIWRCVVWLMNTHLPIHTASHLRRQNILCCRLVVLIPPRCRLLNYLFWSYSCHWIDSFRCTVSTDLNQQKRSFSQSLICCSHSGDLGKGHTRL
jgi:hypothetical protein